MAIHALLLGVPQLIGPNGQSLSGCGQSLRVLALLVAQPGRCARREWITSMLWRDGDTCRARRRLNTALWRLKRVVTEAGLTAEQCFYCDSESIGILPYAQVRLDVDELRACCALARQDDTPLSDAQATRLQQGVRLYRGAYLDGCDDEWCVIERESLSSAYQLVLMRLLEHNRAKGDWSAAIETAERMLAVDPYLERAHRALIMAHGALGDRAASLRHYARCSALLQDELGIAPLRETREALRKAMGRGPRPVPDGGKLATSRSLDALIGDLKSVVRHLEKIAHPDVPDTPAS